MRRPAFSVVTGAVTMLVFLGFLSRLLLPYIPKSAENALGTEASEFLSRASTERIDWLKPTPEAFQEARRKDRPIFLFVGTSSNPFARDLDEGALTSPSVQSFLSRNFVCIRVDALAYPEFRNAYLPLSRTLIGLLPGFQIWILDPSGKVLDLVRREVALFGNDENIFVEALIKARNLFENQNAPANKTDLAEVQRQNTQALRDPGPDVPLPPFDAYSDTLVEMSDTRSGGFMNFGIKTITPEVWRYLLLAGRLQEFRASFDPFLQTPAVDILDGGFFQFARDNEWSLIEFDKTAISNAAMLRLLVQAYSTFDDPYYRWLTEQTFDFIVDGLIENGVVYAYRVSDRSENGRSQRSSFGVKKLREALPNAKDRAWAQTNLGLRVETNPRMAACLPDPTIIQRDPKRLANILQKLRKKTSKPSLKTGEDFLDVSAFTVARLIHTARALGSDERLDKALRLYESLARFQTGDDVIHCEHAGLRSGYLGDYLAFADAALEHYLATGRYASLQTGTSVLKRAMTYFRGSEAGVLNMIVSRPAPMPEDLTVPEIADPQSESTTAQAIRLCQDYARILASSNPELASMLRTTANKATSRFSDEAAMLGQSSAGFFCAAVGIFDDVFVVTTGKNAQTLADTLVQKLPNRLIVPAFADVREDIQKRGDGVFIVRGPKVEGPFTADDTIARLGPR